MAGTGAIYQSFEVEINQSALAIESLTTAAFARIFTVKYIIVQATAAAAGAGATLACAKRSMAGVDTNLLLATNVVVGNLSPVNDSIGVGVSTLILPVDSTAATLGASDMLKITTATANANLRVIFMCSPTADKGLEANDALSIT